MLSVSYTSKNAYNAGKTSGILRDGASGANRGYVLAHWGGALRITNLSQISAFRGVNTMTFVGNIYIRMWVSISGSKINSGLKVSLTVVIKGLRSQSAWGVPAQDTPFKFKTQLEIQRAIISPT